MDRKLFKSLIKSIKQMNKIRRHKSDCALHNAPAYKLKPCDCGVIGNRMKKYLHILILRIRWWLNYGWTFKISIGRDLTSNESGELACWITRNVKEPTWQTLQNVRSGFYGDEDLA